MKGRKAKPTALKRLAGNPGHRKLNDAEPKLPTEAPKPPKLLSKAAKAEWRAIVPVLMKFEILSVVDGKALAGYCQCFSRWAQAEAEIDRLGIIVEEPILNKDGDIVGHKTRKNPACNVAKEMMQQMRSFLSLFGLDPSSRSRLWAGKADIEKEKDPLEQLLRKRAEQRPNVM